MAKWSCKNCGATGDTPVRHCPTCASDLGAPNVREANSTEERSALALRLAPLLDKLVERIGRSGATTLRQHLQNQLGVVFAVPAPVARIFLSDKNQLFNNYELLVGTQRRSAASLQLDRMRRAVGALVFGGYADEIRYGALSLSNRGLRNYGEIFLRIRPLAIQDRTSFLEENSYDFVARHHLAPGGDFPLGHRCVWNNKDELALCKIAETIEPKDDADAWDRKVLTDGADRASDDMIEAHVFGTFNADAVEGIATTSDTSFSQAQKLDIDIAVELFEKRKSTYGAQTLR